MLRLLKPGGTIRLYDVLPLIGDAADYAGASGSLPVTCSPGLMATLNSDRPSRWRVIMRDARGAGRLRR
jgi:hypothetical protein